MLAVFSLAFSIIAFIPRTKGSMFVTVCNASFFILFLFKFSALRGFFLFFSHLLSLVKNKECILIGHSCFFHIGFAEFCKIRLLICAIQAISSPPFLQLFCPGFRQSSVAPCGFTPSRQIRRRYCECCIPTNLRRRRGRCRKGLRWAA